MMSWQPCLPKPALTKTLGCSSHGEAQRITSPPKPLKPPGLFSQRVCQVCQCYLLHGSICGLWSPLLSAVLWFPENPKTPPFLLAKYISGKKKKKKECNPVHTEVPQPMEMYRALNPNKGCMSSKTTVPGKLSIKTCSHARAMSQVLHLKSADFKSSTNLRNCANKISPLPSQPSLEDSVCSAAHQAKCMIN